METVRGEVVVARGACASRGRAQGRARVIEVAGDLARVGAGDVVVLRAAWPAASMVLDRAVAVVAERGGVLCSLGTVARERGVPCLVGVAGVTSIVRDGDVVRVDADGGLVVVLEPAEASRV